MSSPAKGVEHDYSAAGFWSDRAEAWHDFIPGVRRRILVNNSSATMGEFRIVAGGEVPLHSHAQSQFGICLEGGGVFTVGDKSWKLKKGDSYYIPPSVTHGLKVDPASEVRLIEFFTPMRRETVKFTLAAEGP